MTAIVTNNDTLAATAALATTDDRAAIEAAIDTACNRIAPLWPLRDFVAVNPFLGFAADSFGNTCATLRRVAGVDMLMPRDFYRAAIEAGLVEDADLAAALAAAPPAGRPADLAALRQAIARDPARPRESRAVVATVAQVLDMLSAGDRRASRTAFMIDELSKWCAAYFDEGQAGWRLPVRGMPPYQAWRACMRHDRNPEAMGISGFRSTVAALPADPVAAIARVVRELGIPGRALDDYLFRALFDIGGWAGYARHRVWTAARDGRRDDTLVQLLAIRVAWGYALFRHRGDAAFREAWASAMQAAARLPADTGVDDDPDLAVDLLLQAAYERAYQRRLIARLAGPRPGPGAVESRPALQAIFCIDVRSEVFRRALETVCPDAETVGFAGFFGVAFEHVPLGHTHGRAQCPVLLKPGHVVCDTVQRATVDEEQRWIAAGQLRARIAGAWKAFKQSAVSSFAYVETAGPLFAGRLVADSFGGGRLPSRLRIGRPADRVAPRLAVGDHGGRTTGFGAGQRLDIAETILRAMSLKDRFARLVLVTGHAATTANNPHAAGLDCGACGGHSGEANARVAAGILNDAAVRAGLAARGIVVPPDTWFLGCLHDTTTDEIRIFDADALPATHRADLGRLQDMLARASALARAQRSTLLGLSADKDIDRRIVARSRDWSQVRPEWGLAGNAAFIAAPRSRTRGLDLGGRAFLHDYDWRSDTAFGVLELIMTAPMVVASWINLQYYGSTVNNGAFGSGNKVLHNIVGQLGVLEGNGGDLRPGLPWQSVHDGSRLVHEPLRLNVFIEAPESAIDRTIERHGGVRQLVDNGWVHLFRIAEDGAISRRVAGRVWQACP